MGLRQYTPGYLDVTPENYHRWKGKVLWYRTRSLGGPTKSATTFRRVVLQERVGDAAIIQTEDGGRFRIKLRRAEFHKSMPAAIPWTRADYLSARAIGTANASKNAAAHRLVVAACIKTVIREHGPSTVAGLLRHLQRIDVHGVQGKPINRWTLRRVIADAGLTQLITTGDTQ